MFQIFTFTPGFAFDQPILSFTPVRCWNPEPQVEGTVYSMPACNGQETCEVPFACMMVDPKGLEAIGGASQIPDDLLPKNGSTPAMIWGKPEKFNYYYFSSTAICKSDRPQHCPGLADCLKEDATLDKKRIFYNGNRREVMDLVKPEDTDPFKIIHVIPPTAAPGQPPPPPSPTSD